MLRQILRSECGRYRLGPPPDKHSVTGREMFDADGVMVGTTTFWSNQMTNTRVRFETGSGTHKAVFSYPRYPRWFRRRWVSCFDIWVDDLAIFVNSLGGKVVTAWKPDINCWSHIGFKADAETTAKIDAELTRLDYVWNGPPRKPGQWDISCPTDYEQANAEIMANVVARKK